MADTTESFSASRSAEPVEVALVFRHFHPILAGAAERFRRYSVPLKKEGIRYEVFTLRENPEHAQLETQHEGLRVRRIEAQGAPWRRDAVLFEEAWRYLSTVPPQGRLLQTSLAHDLATPWLRKVRALGMNCLYVGTMVGKEEEGLPLWRRWVRQWKNRRNYRPFNTVVASTTVMARWFEACGVERQRIEVIPNGVDVERFRPVADAAEKGELRRTLGLPEGAPVVMFAGSIVPRKGVDLLIRTWPKVLAAVPEARLVLVGGFDRPTFMTRERMEELSRFQESLRALAEQPECRGSVAFAGESDRVEDWLRAADVFVFPTEQEGMGNVVLEAMACGIPNVITDFHGLPKEEFGRAGREFILVDRNEEALAEGLKQALTERAPMEAMGQAAREWACAHLDVRLTLERYARLYHRLARQA
jgi:glycosyltransferase involved in cell wall biosynthesis